MKKNAQLKAIATYGEREWEKALPVGAKPTIGKAGYVPLSSKAQPASSDGVVLKLDERGLAEVLEETPDLAGSVKEAIGEVAASSRSGRIPSTAEVLAVWEIPLPAGIAPEESLEFCKLAYQYVVRSAEIPWELCGTADNGALKIWFVPMTKDSRGQATLSARNLMSRNDYLGLYAALKEYLEDELGHGVDVDADDVMYKEMGFTEKERREAIEERDGMAKAASDFGEKLKEEAQGFAKGFVKNFRKGLTK